MTVISGVSSDKTKIVKFNKMMRKDSDSPSWKANISDNPLVEAFPESIDIHPGLQKQSDCTGSSSVNSFRFDFPQTYQKDGYLYQCALLRNKECLYSPFMASSLAETKKKSKALRRHSYQRTSAMGRQTDSAKRTGTCGLFRAVRRRLLKPQISNASLKPFVSTSHWPMTESNT